MPVNKQHLLLKTLVRTQQQMEYLQLILNTPPNESILQAKPLKILTSV